MPPRSLITREQCAKIMAEKSADELSYAEVSERYGIEEKTLMLLARKYGLQQVRKKRPAVTKGDKAASPAAWQSKAIYVRVIGPAGFDDEYAPKAATPAEAVERGRAQLLHRARFLPMAAGRYRISAGDDAATVVVVEIEVAA